MNVWTISGNLGRDGELKALASGTMLLNFSVAVDSGYGDRKKTNWVKCTKFGKGVENLAPYLTKGQTVVVSGELSLDEWTDKEGVVKSNLALNVRELTLAGKKETGTSSAKPALSGAGPGLEPDDIPF